MASIAQVVLAAERPAEVTVSWKVGVRGGVSAETATQELTAIYARDGVVTDAAIVDAARPADAPLHPAFEWDDAVAAEMYRRRQAANIMHQLVVVYRRPDGEPMAPVRQFVKVQTHGKEEVSEEAELALEPHAYVPIQRVMADEDLRRLYVRQAHRELLSWRRRYDGIERFAMLFEAIDALELDDPNA